MSLSAERVRPTAAERWPALASGLGALALYARCLAPGLTWAHDGADGGDLLAAALTGGVPHPTGYPTYQILLRAVLALLPGDPARAGNWLSAICAAAAVALLADLAVRMLPSRPWRNPVALAAALAWAASPALWSQAVITEVYTTHAFLVALLLWLLWRWRDAAAESRPCWPWLAGAAFVFGIGIGVHLSLALLLPGAAIWLWANRRHLALRRAADGGAILAGLVAGLSTFAYLPLAAARNPPVNWGNPATWGGFVWLVSGQAYRGLLFGVAAPHLLGRVAAWAGEVSRQFAGGPWGIPIALAGLWWLDRRQHDWWRATGLIGLAFSIYAIGYNTPDSYVYLIPAWFVAALWFAAGLFWGSEALAGAWPRLGNSRAFPCVLLVVLLALPSASIARHWEQMDVSHDQEARAFIRDVLTEAAPGGLILTASDRPTFALWYALYGRGLRPDLTPINVNLYPYAWYQQGLVAHHPLLAQQAQSGELPPLEELLSDVAREGSVYRVEPLDLDLGEMVEKPLGILVEIVPR